MQSAAGKGISCAIDVHHLRLAGRKIGELSLFAEDRPSRAPGDQEF